MGEYGIADDELTIPPPESEPPVPPDGAHYLGPGEIFFVIDGNRTGIRTIADAVGLASQLVPGVQAMMAAAAEPPRKANRLATALRVLRRS
jgi:hypothetical protein